MRLLQLRFRKQGVGQRHPDWSAWFAPAPRSGPGGRLAPGVRPRSPRRAPRHPRRPGKDLRHSGEPPTRRLPAAGRPVAGTTPPTGSQPRRGGPGRGRAAPPATSASCMVTAPLGKPRGFYGFSTDGMQPQANSLRFYPRCFTGSGFHDCAAEPPEHRLSRNTGRFAEQGVFSFIAAIPDGEASRLAQGGKR